MRVRCEVVVVRVRCEGGARVQCGCGGEVARRAPGGARSDGRGRRRGKAVEGGQGGGHHDTEAVEVSGGRAERVRLVRVRVRVRVRTTIRVRMRVRGRVRARARARVRVRALGFSGDCTFLLGAGLGWD